MSCNCPTCNPPVSRRSDSYYDVHMTTFQSEADAQILCSKLWTYPYPEDYNTGDPEVLMSEDSFKYTKEKTKVTCARCLEKMGPQPCTKK